VVSRGGGLVQSHLAQMPAILSLSGLRRATRAVRAALELAATLPAMLGPELREPIMDLRSVRSRGLRDDALSTRRTAAGRAGPVRCSARVPLSRRWRPWETRPSRRTIARRGPRPRLHRWRRKLKRSITGKGTTQASQRDLPGGLRNVTPRSLGTFQRLNSSPVPLSPIRDH
jgi:hypothetical protein